MAKATFGWRTSLNGRAAAIEGLPPESESRVPVEEPAPKAAEDTGDVWWTAVLVQLFMLGAIVMATAYNWLR